MNEIRVEPEEVCAERLPHILKVLPSGAEVLVCVLLPGTDLLTHEEHRNAWSKQGHPGCEVHTALGVVASLARQGRAIDSDGNGAGRVNFGAVVVVV